MGVLRRFLLLVCGLVVAACGQTSPSSLTTEDAVPSATPSYGPATRSQACPSVQPQHLPGNLSQIQRAYVCVNEVRSVPGDGEWMFDVVKGVTGGLAELLAAYAPADAHPTSGACTTELPNPLIVYLDTEQPLAVRAPRDPCSKPTAAARTAYEGLGLQEVAAVKLSQVTSQDSLDTTCSDVWKDVLAVEEGSGSPAQRTSAPLPLQEPIRLCVYEVRTDSQGERLGHLTSGRVLTAEQVHEVNAELAGSIVDPTCGRHDHTGFALLQSADAGGVTLVALDGCAVQQDGGWWRATAGLRELVRR